MDIRLTTFKHDIQHHYPTLSEAEWESLEEQLTPISYKKEEVVFPSHKICRQVLFVSQGIFASEFHNSAKLVISRFFTQNDLGSNIVSLMKEEKSDDQLLAITEAHGVLIPYRVFGENYLYADGIGLYFRKKLLQVILADKQYIAMKTLPNVQDRLAHLQECYPEVILETPWKHIANFLGVTPAWLSRVLNKKQVRKDS